MSFYGSNKPFRFGRFQTGMYKDRCCLFVEYHSPSSFGSFPFPFGAKIQMQPGNSYSRVFSVLVSFGLLTLVTAAADRTSEQGEAIITGSSFTSSSSIFFPQEFTFSFTHSDPTEECTPYEYAPVTDALNSFPPVWKGASILSSDSAALAMWNSISDSIPTDIAVKVSFYASFISSCLKLCLLIVPASA